MNIIRVLKLYKQHYLKNYAQMAVKEYSCLGYFDCMSVELVKNRVNRGLLRTKGNVNITDLWYTIANNTEALNGYYGQQNIGMFRYETEDSEIRDEEFWKEEQEAIILVGCMIQLADDVQIKDSIVEIEELVHKQEGEKGNIQGITYRTFDNFDFILFLKGNSYIAISDLIDVVRNRPDVKYTYSVCGIAQQYLDMLGDVDEKTDIDDIKYNDVALINDTIAEICLEIVNDGKEKLNDFFSGFGTNVEYASVIGYTDNMIRIKNTDMKHVTWLLRDGNNGITHKNSKFGKEIYNISTVIVPELRTDRCEDASHSSDSPEGISSWCMKEIERLRLYRNKLDDSKNEVLYSNWLALIRVLNVLSQYENAVFPKDIFRIIFPSVNLICRKFEGILNGDKLKEFSQRELDEIVIIEEYINEVDSTIQHLIHTSQNFLTVPGYSGSLYDIPTRLLLFYMAFARKIIEQFNDSEQVFECIICPLLNSKPAVKEIKAGSREMLLDIRLAQRHLYMPRAFLIILLHELFHYVGCAYRCRQDRAVRLIKMCAYAITYELLPIEENIVLDQKKTVPWLLINEKQIQIQETLINIIADILNRDFTGEIGEIKYLSGNLRKKLTKSCEAALHEPRYGLDETIRELPDLSRYDADDVRTLLIQWSESLKEVESNKKNLLAENTIEVIVGKFLYNFQEIYADLSSIICLDLELEYYLEAIPISEGMTLNEKVISTVVINRLAVVIYVLQKYPCAQQKKSWKEQWEKLVNDKTFPQKWLIDEIAAYINQMTGSDPQINGSTEQKEMLEEDDIVWPYFYLDGVWWQQVGYAQECIKKLREEVPTFIPQKELRDIRDVFDLFKMYDKDRDKTYDELFNIYDQLVQEYSREIDQMIKTSMERTESANTNCHID